MFESMIENYLPNEAVALEIMKLFFFIENFIKF